MRCRRSPPEISSPSRAIPTNASGATFVTFAAWEKAGRRGARAAERKSNAVEPGTARGRGTQRAGRVRGGRTGGGEDPRAHGTLRVAGGTAKRGCVAYPSHNVHRE